MALKITSEGFYQYTDAKFFCEGIAEYAGCELDPGGVRWGLEQQKLYNVYRPKSEVTNPRFVESCNQKPLCDDHPEEGGVGNRPDLRKNIDSIGVLSNVKVVGNELHGQIDVWSPEAIEKIKSGKVQLSLGYEATFRKVSGEWNGQHYDFVQSGLVAANHLALVDEARNGRDCRVKDSRHICDSKIKLENPEMDFKTMDANTLIEGLKQCSDECKAKAKEFLTTPTADELAKQEAEKKAAEEQKAKDEAAAKEKTEAEKKEAVDAAVAECQKQADEKAEQAKKDAEKEKTEACDAAVEDFKAAAALANDAKPLFGNVSFDGVKTEKDMAMKLCSLGDKICDGKFAHLKNVKPEGAVDAVRTALALAGTNSQKIVDSAAKVSQEAADFWAKH